MSDFLGLADPSRPIIGDMLRQILYAARAHPDADLRTDILAALDSALSAVGAPSFRPDELAAALSHAEGTLLAPMTFTSDDVAVATRVWRACSAAGWGGLFLGSADAIGESYGARIDSTGCAEYRARGKRLGVNERFLSAINLGLLPDRAQLTPTVLVEAYLEGSQQHGLSISVFSTDLARVVVGAQANSFAFRGEPGRGVVRAPLGSLGLSVSSQGEVVTVTPATAEGAIRLATLCASRAMLCLGRGSPPGIERGALVVALRPIDAGRTDLATETWSSRGALADWLRTPPLPMLPILTVRVRSRIAAWLAESHNGTTGEAR